MEADYLREQESESAGASGSASWEDKVMKTAAQFFWEGFASLWVSRAGLHVAPTEHVHLRCAGWKKTLILS